MKVFAGRFALAFILLQCCLAESTESDKQKGAFPHPDCPDHDDIFNPKHLPKPEDCSKFYKCLGGLAYEMDCPPGLHWSVSTNQCDWPNVAQCTPVKPVAFSIELTNNDSPIAHPDCPLEDDPNDPTQLAYPGDCTKFYKCSGGLAYTMSCPPNLHWSVEYNRCDYPQEAKCDTKIQILRTNGLVREDPKPHPECPLNDTPNQPKHLPYPNDCTKFYKCSYGLAYPMDCPPGHHWSIKLDRCDWPAVAECEEQPDPTTTTTTTTTTTSTTTTTTTSTEKPPPPVTEGCRLHPELSIQKHPTDCDKFILCDHGDGQVMQCPDDLHYSVETTRCEDPAIAKCEYQFYYY